MKAFFRALLLLPVAVVVLAFAFANRQTVNVSFDPFDSQAPAFVASLPLFVVLFAALIAGILVGGMSSWLSGRKRRKEARRYRAEAERLRAELANQAAKTGGAGTSLRILAERSAA